ncbi:death domain-containing protein CRADD [Anguilla rostrata]|uniref:death domain-containing protein CRADD n=1 Tax=Anguilla rostrata TaxID=7938 RepID=UPI0030CCEAF5
MDPRHKEFLRKHRLDLSNQVLIDDTVVHYLYQENILTESHVEEIQAQTTNKKRTLKLLDILPTRGPHAFGAFLKSLEEEFVWVAERLQRDLQNGASAEQDPSDLCGISEEVLRKVPSDKELNRLSGLLGPEWESVLLDLGVSACQLFRCRADHPHSLQSQVLAGLMVWRQSRGRSATFRQLLQSLRAAQIHPSVIEQVFRQEGGEGDLAHCPKGSGKTAPIL